MFTTLQVVQRLSPGGIETMSLDFARDHNSNERNFIVSLEGTESELMENWPRLSSMKNQLFFLDKAKGVSADVIRQLVRLSRFLKVDCIHTHHIGPLIYGGIAAKAAGVEKHIHTEHDAWHLNNTKHALIQRFMAKICKPTFVADSNLVAEQLSRKVASASINTVYNGIDTQRFIINDQGQARDSLNLPNNAYIIGCAGRLEKVKGQAVLINALKSLPEHIHLALAGVGSQLFMLKQLVTKLQLSHRVHFLGLIDQMEHFYPAIDLFCLPSFNEGFPLSILEAQSCGISCVVTNTGASEEALCKDTGYLVTPGNVEELAAALMQGLRKVMACHVEFNASKPTCIKRIEQADITRKNTLYMPITPLNSSIGIEHATYSIADMQIANREFVLGFASLNQMLDAYAQLKRA